MASLIKRIHHVAQKLIDDSRALRRADPEEIQGRQGVSGTAGGDTSQADDFQNRILRDLNVCGVYKTTLAGRLVETERALSRYLKEAGKSKIRLLDIGASDGTTTLDLVNAIRKDVDVEAYLADRFLELHRYRLGPLVEYRTASGSGVMVRMWKVALSVSTHRPDAVAQLYHRASWLRRSFKPAGRIPLVDPRVLREPGIRVKAMDCFEREASLEGHFDAVRASNILCLCYFTPERISIALDHLYAYLKEGGLLVISRNLVEGDHEVEHGSIWRRSGGGFEHLSDFGNGSEIRDLVDLVTAEKAPDRLDGVSAKVALPTSAVEQ